MSDDSNPMTEDQARALDQIITAHSQNTRHLLTGHAGTGKSWLMTRVAQEFLDRDLEIAVCAPTHKAVAVLARKLDAEGLDDVPCLTLHSLLSLEPYPDGDRTRLRRRGRAHDVSADVVIVDETSMVSEELQAMIDRFLPDAFVLYVGDPAQLPPVGEAASRTFATPSYSNLSTIVRQAAGNPILGAAHAIRQSQGGPLDLSWCRPAKAPPLGVFVPGASTEKWLRRAFTSDAFAADNDRFRYLAWTNRRVAEINAQVREWRYGKAAAQSPFLPGERVLLRAPIFIDEHPVLMTNQEVEVADLAPDTFDREIPDREGTDGWNARFASWKVALLAPDGGEIAVHTPRNQAEIDAIDARLKAEAAQNKARWYDRFEFHRRVARMQAVYSLTVHCAQGSTFVTSFVDVADISRRARTNVLETQQLLYVACTRPSESLVLV